MSIVLNSKTYNWSGWTPQGASSFIETSGGVPNSFSPLTAQVTLNESKTANRISWKLKVPYVVTEDSSCGCLGDVIDEDIVDIVVRPSRKRSAAGRTDLLARIRDLVDTSQFGNSITSLTTPSS